MAGFCDTNIGAPFCEVLTGWGKSAYGEGLQDVAIAEYNQAQADVLQATAAAKIKREQTLNKLISVSGYAFVFMIVIYVLAVVYKKVI